VAAGYIVYGPCTMMVYCAGTGVHGYASASTGTTYGGNFESSSSSGSGVYGRATSSTGPRFSGGRDTMVVFFEDNSVYDSQYGIRVYGSVQAFIRYNTFRPGSYGIYIYENARVRAEYNDIQDARSRGVIVKDLARIDLGGGLVNIGGDTTSSLGFNILKASRYMDLANQTPDTVRAENNVWDHATSVEVLVEDVEGPVDVVPLGISGGPSAAED